MDSPPPPSLSVSVSVHTSYWIAFFPPLIQFNTKCSRLIVCACWVYSQTWCSGNWQLFVEPAKPDEHFPVACRKNFISGEVSTLWPKFQSLLNEHLKGQTLKTFSKNEHVSFLGWPESTTTSSCVARRKHLVLGNMAGLQCLQKYVFQCVTLKRKCLYMYITLTVTLSNHTVVHQKVLLNCKNKKKLQIVK